MRRFSPGLLAGFVVAASALATAASAADMPVPAAPAYYPPAYHPVVYDWTGIYVGAHVGAGLLDDVVTTTTTTALLPSGTQNKLNPFGVVGGAQGGFNIEFAPFVIGAEATWTSSGISGTGSVTSLMPGIFEQSTSNPLWYATVTGKVGIAANDWLFYAKGGAAWMRVDYTQGVLVSGAGMASLQTVSDHRTGFTVGGGVEYGLTENLSAKIEYDFLDFGTKSYSYANLGFFLPGSPAGTAVTPIAPTSVSIKSFTSLFTVGLNYRYNWSGGGAAVTK
jgi:outer membrane immunogenic protein